MFEPKIVAYLCTWCSYTGADTAGIARLKSPPNLRAVRVPCSGRVSPELVMRTFDQGADGVLILACHVGECHYDTGNHRTAKRVPILNSLMSFAGLEPQRLRLDYVSASEGERFSRITTEFVETVRSLGPVHWRVRRDERASLSPRIVFEPPSNRSQARQENSSQQEQDMRHQVKRLLEEKLVDRVIGYETSLRGRVRPIFITDPKDAERLVWNKRCVQNLLVYVTGKSQANKGNGRTKRTGLVVKSCDLRAVNVLLVENQISPGSIYLIEVECDGMLDKKGQLQSRCAACEQKPDTAAVPEVERITIKKTGGGTFPGTGQNPLDQRVSELDAMAPVERMEFWLSQFDRCIRCYACRQACPMCSCPTCLYERDDPVWVGAVMGRQGIGLNEKRAFHLGRAFHLAGRCTGCEACEQACPVGIPLNLLNHRLVMEMQALFGFQAGTAPVHSPVVTGFEQGIPQAMVQEG